MENKNTQVATISDKAKSIAKILDASVVSIVGAKYVDGFEKAFMVSSAINTLKASLSDEYMKPIMELQGNKLGFKTDKDKDGGYPLNVVRNCLIEAVLMGFQPVGNQFNIIAGNTYGTKEGYGYLLKNIEGLSWSTVAELPRIDSANTKAAITMNVEWQFSGQDKNSQKLDFPIKVNAYMGADGVIGKAERKARAWLYNRIMNTELPEGDASDIIPIQGKSVEPTKEDKENERLKKLIENSIGVAELEQYADEVGIDLKPIYDAKMAELSGKLV